MKTKVPVWVSILIVAIVFIIVGVGFWWYTRAGKVKINPVDGAAMVWVPAGDFTMGSTDEQTATALKELVKSMGLSEGTPTLLGDHFSVEKPQHKVYLDGFWIYRNEVTVAQYRRFCKSMKKTMPKAPTWGWKDDNPMVYVSQERRLLRRSGRVLDSPQFSENGRKAFTPAWRASRYQLYEF